MCSNTLAAMNQLVTEMNEQGPQFLNSIGREERRAFQELFNVCEDFVRRLYELERRAG
jgi:predicted nucleic acid-binding OB-fold protein